MLKIKSAAAGKIALNINFRGDKVTSIDLNWNINSQKDHHPENHCQQLQSCLESYVEGQKTTWPEFEFDFSGLTPFRQKILKTLYARIGWGNSISYGELAALAGSPKAARAVGGAMASNPFPLIIPCHRVLGSNRSITGFSGCGPEMKKYLLNIEGISWK